MTNVVIPEWDLCDRLRKSLAVSGVTIPEMADALMVSRNSIGNYLAGRTTPKPVYLRVWADRCGVDIEWLTGKSDYADLRNARSRCNARAA